MVHWYSKRVYELVHLARCTTVVAVMEFLGLSALPSGFPSTLYFAVQTFNCLLARGTVEQQPRHCCLSFSATGKAS